MQDACSRAGSEDVSADLGGVQVVVDEGVNEGGDLASHNEVTGGLESVNDLSKSSANLKYFYNKIVDLS